MPLSEMDLRNTVLKRLSIDEYEPKTGDSQDVMVLGFHINDSKPGKDLYKFLNIKLNNKLLFNNKNLLNEGLTCRIIYNNHLCEFLINHINLDKKHNQFQIETGPVLLMKNNKDQSYV